MSLTVRVHAWVSGRVQGVGYRAATEQQARRLGLSGWVRNLPDGRVELVAEGQSHAVEQLLTWCRQGPPLAVVTDVRHSLEGPEGLSGFEQRR